MGIAVGMSSPGQKTTTRRRVAQRLVVLVSLTLVLLAAGAALVLVQGIDRQINDVVYTYEVRNKARELTISLSEAESSQRGYTLTQDQSYLDAYERSVAAIDTRMAALIEATQPDPGRSERVRVIANEVASKVAEMARSVQLAEAPRTSEAQIVLQTGMGERLMDNLRGMLEKFIAEENAKLLERNAQIDQSRRWLVGAIILALASAVLMAYALFARTQRQVSALARNQDLLMTENEELEAHVQERTQALEEARLYADQERKRVETLLQDTNHRIGNSLATVSSLLGLQLMRSQSPEVRAALEAARSRVHAIASSHRRLRLGDDLETASADEFLDAVLDDIAETAGDGKSIKLVGKFDPIVIGARDATTVGILVGELVTNAVKHAFPDRSDGSITVTLNRDSEGVPMLSVIDDGVGIDGDIEPGGGGLGSVIVKQLAAQFGGAPQYERMSGGGLSVKVPLPGLENNRPPAVN